MKENFLLIDSKNIGKDNKNYLIKSIIIIICIIKLIIDLNSNTFEFSFVKFIYRLNKNSNNYKKENILLFDYIDSKTCEDINAYIIFQYFQNINNDKAYYVVNEETELYKSLVAQNKTKNIIPIKDSGNVEQLYPYLLNTKIIVQSYALYNYQHVISYVKYLKFLYLCHAVNYFKIKSIKIELLQITEEKKNIIMTSPYEYNLYKKLNLYREESLHPAGLPRYDRFKLINKNESEKDCILMSFTFRPYNNSVYENSLYKKNLIDLLSDQNLISFLEDKNIDFIYIMHHYDVLHNRTFNQDLFPKIKFKGQNLLGKYIEQCSLYITDFSSVSFDFMFQNKPVIFYHIDVNDPYDFEEKKYMTIDYDNSIYYNNVFSDKEKLIDKIKYFVNNNFELDEPLKAKYKNMFYNKENITEKIVEVIYNIMNQE